MAIESLQEGTRLNERYLIKGVLGQGGMGTVYMAEHMRLEAIVAVKEVHALNAVTGQDLEDLRRCEQEARFLVRLNHPNLPKVTDAFIEDDRFYLVMDYIEGVTLETCLRDEGRGPLDVAQVIEWGLQIADVLAYLHAQNPPIIFRDVKPANIMVQPDGNIKLIDFGIARRFEPGAMKDTSLLGSVGYSPPEQFGRHQTDERSDIYAFAATLHHLLTGRDPAIQPFKFPPARSLNPAIPESLSRLLEACLSMEPDARPASITDVALGLVTAREHLVGLPSSWAGRPGPLADGSAAKPATSQSGNARIISAKLKQAETDKRRVARQSYPQKSRGGLLALSAVVFVLTATGIVAAVVGNSRKHHPNVLPISPTSLPNTSLPSTSASVTTPPGTDASGDVNSSSTGHGDQPGPGLPSGASSDVAVQAGNIVVEQPGEFQLPITVSGTIRGHAGVSGVVAVFFYDINGKHLFASDSKSTEYANPDGHLSIAHTLQIAGDEQPFIANLSVPLRQFPATVFGTSVKIQAFVRLDRQNFYSDFITVPIPQNLGADQSGQPGNTTGPSDNSPTQPNGSNPPSGSVTPGGTGSTSGDAGGSQQPASNGTQNSSNQNSVGGQSIRGGVGH